MKRITLLFLILFYTNLLDAQSWDCQISGTILKNSGEVAARCKIILFKDEDTLCVTQTDQNGAFDFIAPFTVGNSYVFLYETYGQTKKVTLFKNSDSIPVFSFLLNLTLKNIKWDKFDNSAYYGFNETKNCDNFDLEFLKYSLEEYPGVCIEFIQVLDPKETKAIARERMNNFRKLILESGINPKQVRFSKQVLNWNKTETEEQVRRSCIQGRVVSINGTD